MPPDRYGLIEWHNAQRGVDVRPYAFIDDVDLKAVTGGRGFMG
jgi:hypothetical protein